MNAFEKIEKIEKQVARQILERLKVKANQKYIVRLELESEWYDVRDTFLYEMYQHMGIADMLKNMLPNGEHDISQESKLYEYSMHRVWLQLRNESLNT